MNAIDSVRVSASLAWAYLKVRPLAALLNVALLALGVAAIVMLLLLGTQLEARSEKDAAGIDLVVGAKGSPLQLVLSSVYHVDVPTGNIEHAEAERIAALPMVKHAVPLALGDSFRRFRIVGTDARFDALYGLSLASGTRAMQPMQAVIGDEVARETGLAVGGRFAGNHGLSEAGAEHRETPFTVTGVLAPTGSVVDRLVLTPLASVWSVHAHGDQDADREITALLIQYASPLAAARLPREINAGSAAQAASPAAEMTRLFGFLGVGIELIKAFAGLMIVVAALGIFLALSGALADRRADLALLRVLGASRGVVFASVMWQGCLVGVAGVILGLALGHGALEGLGVRFAQPQGIPIGGGSWVGAEAWVIAGCLALALVAAAIPAWRAYREAATAALVRN